MGTIKKNCGRWAALSGVVLMLGVFAALATPTTASAAVTPQIVDTVAAVSVPAALDNVDPSAPGAAEGTLNTLLGWGKWIALIAGAAGLVICGVQLSLGRRGRSQMAADGAIGVPWALGGISLVMLAIPLVNAVMTVTTQG